MSMGEVIEFIESFAKVTGAPVLTEANVTSLRSSHDGYHLMSSRGEIHCQAVIIASGACNKPAVPAFANAVPASVQQLTPFDYRNPDRLAEGGVLVVGASATGVQLAAELQRSGRPVTLSIGEHVRLPRTYRGRDVLWWMDASGIWDQRYDEIDDLTRARRLPSPQLVGTSERDTLDLNALASMGVELVGRWADIRNGRALFSGGLRNMFTLADLKLGRLLDTFDAWALDHGRDAEAGTPERLAPTCVPETARLQLDLRNGEIRRSYGQRASAPITGGSTCRCSIRKASWFTRGEWSTCRGYMRWDFPCYAGASPLLSTGLRTTLVRWSITWCDICP
jgi:putative flavoprotein involved in K+ transport